MERFSVPAEPATTAYFCVRPRSFTEATSSTITCMPLAALERALQAELSDSSNAQDQRRNVASAS